MERRIVLGSSEQLCQSFIGSIARLDIGFQIEGWRCRLKNENSSEHTNQKWVSESKIQTPNEELMMKAGKASNCEATLLVKCKLQKTTRHLTTIRRGKGQKKC